MRCAHEGQEWMNCPDCLRSICPDCRGLHECHSWDLTRARLIFNIQQKQGLRVALLYALDTPVQEEI